jgi:predicted CXXCH cytochrome family protein
VSRSSRFASIGTALAFSIAGALGVALHARGVEQALARPLSFQGAGYSGSNECKRCHPSNHASWHRTFHRTMTQDAGPSSVLGDFADARFDYGGIRAHMTRDPRGGFAIELSALANTAPGAALATAPDALLRGTRFTVARTVGSRRYQQYLTRVDDVYVRLPVAWNIAEQRWMHLNGAFLTPDPEPSVAGRAIARSDYDRHVARWNDNCIYCHNVAAQPGLDPWSGRFDSRVAELGIACEACHGPGDPHVRANRDPLRRFALHLSGRADPTIANPSRLTPQRSAEICGHCHGQRIAPEIEQVHRFGDRYLPGEPLARHSQPLWRSTTLNGAPGAFEPRFWPDGTARLTAYEYQGLLQSACAQRGALTCTSCHSMHAGDPRGQLDPARPGDAACTSCHAELASKAQLRAHSRHAAGGEGARCINCHMPRVVYGLVGAHRSHRIDSPQPALANAVSRPDACTLCHVDKTRAWAARSLADWAREDARAQLNAPAAGDADADAGRELAEITRLLLTGDPIERALAADALGRNAFADTAPAELARRAGLLFDSLRDDAYPAVRAIAWRSLRAVLSTNAPGRVPPVAAFTATDDRDARARQLAAIAAQLPAGAIETIPRDLAALRSHATDTAIFIGE